MKVLFTSQRPYERAENLRTVYDAYTGDKTFVQLDSNRRHPLIVSGQYDLMVTDEFPAQTPGKVIVVWHAIDGGKTVGLDQPGPYVSRNQMQMITWITTSGTGTVPIISKSTGLQENKVAPVGLPRTDAYINASKGDGNTILADKKHAYLYAPTFRTAREPSLPNIDLGLIDYLLTDRELFVIKPHPCTGKMLNGSYKHILEAPSSEPSANYLFDCDVVITDYSSIMFDAYLLNKPVVLFEKTPGYTSSRGMYFKYPDAYSSRYCTSEYDMIRMAREAHGLNDTEKAIIHTVADMCDGHATERICNLIQEELGRNG